VVALRPPDRRLHTGKPATKLINAWRAGAPAVLGPEVAYRELRRSELDYLEAASLAEARAAVERLAGDPQLYRAMVDNGHTRARELSFAATTGRWAELLFETLPPLAAPLATRRRPPLPLRIAGRRLLRWATLRPAH
jgi:hypothetical protein